MDEGWTRWVLEQYGFEYVTLRPADFKSPLTRQSRRRDPRRRCAAAAGGSGGGGRGGGGAAAGPVRPEYADRLSPADLAAFEQFVRGGGTVVCLNSASTFAIQQFKLPVKNVVAGLRPEEFFLHGRSSKSRRIASQQVMAGMPEKAAVFADSSPVFETQEGFKGTVLARYAGHRFAAAVRLPDWREVPARQGGGTRRAARRRPRDPARLPAGVARPAVRHVQGALQRGPQLHLLRVSDRPDAGAECAPGRRVLGSGARVEHRRAVGRRHPAAASAKYPRTTADALLAARAYAYGG